MNLIKNSYDKKSMTLYSPYPAPKYVKTSQVKSLFFYHLFEDYPKLKCRWLGLKICFKRVINVSFSVKRTSKSKSLTIYSKISYLLLSIHNKFKWLDGKTWWKLVIVFSLLSHLSVIFVIFTANNLSPFVLAVPFM